MLHRRNTDLKLALAVAGGLSVAAIALEPAHEPTRNDPVVERVHQNLLRVHLNGRSEELSLMPLADHLCQSPSRYFAPYCDD